MAKELLRVNNLKKYFHVGGGLLHAIDGISFSINEGDTLGLVGESGCGKSTVGNVLIRLLPPTDGEAIYDDVDIFHLKGAEAKRLCREIQIIFQDPYSSLNPKKTIRSILSEAYIVQNICPKNEIDQRIEKLCTVVNLPLDILDKYPHELDGG